MMNNLFDVLIGCLCFFCIYNMDIVVFLDLKRITLYLVCIEHKNQNALLISLIITQDVHQLIPCRLNTDFRQFFQLFPCENDIVSVNQQIFLHGFFFFKLLFGILTFISFRCQSAFSFYFSICPDKYLFQLFFFRFGIDFRSSCCSWHLTGCLLRLSLCFF